MLTKCEKSIYETAAKLCV